MKPIDRTREPRETAAPPYPLPVDRSGKIAIFWPIVCLASVAITLGLISQEALLWGQPGEATSSPSNPADKPATAVPQAAEILRRAQAQIVTHQSIRAEVQELAHLTTPPLQMTGNYLSAGIKLRLDYHVKLAGGVEGELLEVCDGERLWSFLNLPTSRKVTRRDVRQILAAVERAQGNPDRAAAVDLALGGLPGLLTSLQRSMVFDSVKEELLDEAPVYTLTGKWNAQLSEQLGGDPNQPRLPPHIPDAARISLAKESLMPVRLAYLKRTEEGVKLLLDLRFRNIVLDGPVNDSEFDFTPPEGIDPEDVTRDYLRQLFPEQSASESPAP